MILIVKHFIQNYEMESTILYAIAFGNAAFNFQKMHKIYCKYLYKNYTQYYLRVGIYSMVVSMDYPFTKCSYIS